MPAGENRISVWDELGVEHNDPLIRFARRAADTARYLEDLHSDVILWARRVAGEIPSAPRPPDDLSPFLRRASQETEAALAQVREALSQVADPRAEGSDERSLERTLVEGCSLEETAFKRRRQAPQRAFALCLDATWEAASRVALTGQHFALLADETGLSGEFGGANPRKAWERLRRNMKTQRPEAHMTSCTPEQVFLLNHLRRLSAKLGRPADYADLVADLLA